MFRRKSIKKKEQKKRIHISKTPYLDNYIKEQDNLRDKSIKDLTQIELSDLVKEFKIQRLKVNPKCRNSKRYCMYSLFTHLLYILNKEESKSDAQKLQRASM